MGGAPDEQRSLTLVATPTWPYRSLLVRHDDGVRPQHLPRRILAVALALGAVASAQSLKPIFDARLNLEPGRPTPAERTLLERVVRPEAARAWRGNPWCEDEFEVLDVASGAFTRARARQRLFLYRFCSTARAFANNGLAVAEGGAIVSHFVYEGGNEYAVGALPDLTGNGLAEVIVAGGSTNMGETYSGINLLEFTGGFLKRFGQLSTYWDDCGGVPTTNTVEANRLYARPGASLAFFEETFRRRCDGSGNWTSAGASKRVYPDPDETVYQRVR